jgi:hypothetical protein
VIGLVITAKTQGLEYDDERRQSHRELRKEVMKGNGEGEVKAMN